MTVAPQANHTLSGCMPAPSGVAMPVMSGTRVSRSVMPVAEDHPNVAASRLSRDVAASNSNNSVPAGGARGAADFRARLAANGSMAADDTLRPLVPNTRTPEPIPGNKSDSLEGTFKIPTDAEGRSAPPGDTRSSQGLLNLPVPLQAAVVSNATTPKPPQAPRRIWVSQSAAPESLPDSLRLQVPEPTQSRVVAGVSQRNFTNETAETTATVFQRRPSTTEPDLGYARASRIETPAISQPSPSNMNATAAFQNKSLSEDGAHRAAPSNAPAPESLARTVQPVRGPREGEPRQKDPEGPAAQKLGPEPAQARPASESNEVRLTVGAVQSGGPVTVRSVDEVPANAEASTPPPQHTLDPQFAIPAPPAATRQISLKLPGTGNVAVQLRERAGKIEVAVRSGDSQLTKSLQSGLGDLVMRLENQGFKTQAWVPAGARQTATGLGTRESSSSQQGEQSGTSSGNQQREAHSNSRRQPRPRARFEESLEDARMK